VTFDSDVAPSLDTLADVGLDALVDADGQ